MTPGAFSKSPRRSFETTMNAEHARPHQRDSLQFSLAALFVVTTILAALFAYSGANAILLLPLLLVCGLLVAWGRLVESDGWAQACLYLLRFFATGALPFAGGVAAPFSIWFVVFIASRYDDAFANSVLRRGAFTWLVIPAVVALAWFVSSRRWSYRGCWAFPSFVAMTLLPQALAALNRSTASELELREAGLAYAFAAVLFVAGYLGERRRRRALNTPLSPAPPCVSAGKGS